MKCQKGTGEGSIQHLFMEINRRYLGKCFGQLTEYGIHPGQAPVLQVLWKQDGRSQKEIADSLCVKPPTVNVTVQRLERAGFVCRRQDERDQRVSRIFLTEKGREVLGGIQEQVCANEKAIFGNFSETELCLLRRFLEQIIESIEMLPVPERKHGAANEGEKIC